jgi:hypothetical protein
MAFKFILEWTRDLAVSLLQKFGERVLEVRLGIDKRSPPLQVQPTPQPPPPVEGQ